MVYRCSRASPTVRTDDPDTGAVRIELSKRSIKPGRSASDFILTESDYNDICVRYIVKATRMIAFRSNS
jgi:hypothetical protein